MSSGQLKYADVLEAAVADGVLTFEEMAEIEAAKSSVGAEISDAKMVDVFNKLVNAILEDGKVTSDEVASAEWLAQSLGVSKIVAGDALAALGLMSEAQAAVEGGSKGVDVGSVRLHRGEVACLRIDAYLMGVKKRREYVGGSRGVSFRIAKGVSYRVGAFKGHSETIEEEVLEASGRLIVTSKRLIFSSSQRSFTIPLQKIFSLDIWKDGALVHSESRKKPYLFTFFRENGALFGAAMRWTEQQ